MVSITNYIEENLYKNIYLYDSPQLNRRQIL